MGRVPDRCTPVPGYPGHGPRVPVPRWMTLGRQAQAACTGSLAEKRELVLLDDEPLRGRLTTGRAVEMKGG
eukprot:2744861-Rhodomonas_salina.2